MTPNPTLPPSRTCRLSPDDLLFEDDDPLFGGDPDEPFFGVEADPPVPAPKAQDDGRG